MAQPPFCDRCLLMGADHGIVGHLERIQDKPALIQGLKYPLPKTPQCPALALAKTDDHLPNSPDRSSHDDPVRTTQQIAIRTSRCFLSLRPFGARITG